MRTKDRGAALKTHAFELIESKKTKTFSTIYIRVEDEIANEVARLADQNGISVNKFAISAIEHFIATLKK